MKKIINTSMIPIGAIIRTQSPDKGYCVVEIVHNLPECLVARTEEGISLNLLSGDEIPMYYWIDEKKGGCVWKGRFLGSIDTKPGLVTFSHENISEWSEKRLCVLADVHIPLRFFALPVEGEHRIIESDNPVFMQGTVVRLSDREAVINCEPPPGHILVRGHLLLSGNEIAISGRIVPVERERYSIEFMGLMEKDRRIIRNYVYQRCYEQETAHS
jgi:hypothetical protein